MAKPKRCDFYWADFDRCDLVDGHEGGHAVGGPRCGSLNPQGIPCDEVWHHSYAHRAHLSWPAEVSDGVSQS